MSRVVLVVDDEPSVLDVTTQMLEDLGCGDRPTTVLNGDRDQCCDKADAPSRRELVAVGFPFQPPSARHLFGRLDAAQGLGATRMKQSALACLQLSVQAGLAQDTAHCGGWNVHAHSSLLRCRTFLTASSFWNSVRLGDLTRRTNRDSENTMKAILAAACVLALASISPAEAKGCIKGAIVGGVAGHMAGHGKLGAAAGCAIGHHEANKPNPNNSNAQAPAPQK